MYYKIGKSKKAIGRGLRPSTAKVNKWKTL